ncbi:hypothetical protein [Nocardiopsis dassonvillei]|uniref:hypothetical protein n=1 Tax=Nocardiopsis dassonvillei TaxID=2014 RepID=UPI003640AC43
MTDTYEYSSAWTESLKAEGRAEDILLFLDARGIEVSAEARERISACRDHDQLSTWARRSAVVNHVDELFAE